MAASTYNTKEVARLARLGESRVRRCARDGLLEELRRGRALAFGFRDLLVLRTVGRLVDAGVPFARVSRAMRALRRALPKDTSLSSTQVFLQDGRIVASDGARAWDVETGQCSLPWRREVAAQQAASVETLAGDAGARALPRWTPTRPACVEDPTTAGGWFDFAVRHEDTQPQRAYDAYLKALACDPEHPEAHINIGRLCSAAGETARAAAYFRQAIRIDPTQPIAHFNLGVTLHDLGDVHGAIVAYRTALLHDPAFADAHYNLAALLEQQGDLQGAVKHMNAYRVVSRPEPSS